ncbi:hypothetical protein ACUM6W_02395 [Acinetobacter tandoii]|uniref:hypothetical protein n=1 Tax=Acinetobacter tandoii TaxID=202954 RepID=UPI0040456B2F
MENSTKDTLEIEKKAIEKQKALFDFYKSELEIIKSDFYKLEDKASKYLTALTVLTTVLLVLIKDVLDGIELSLISIFMIGTFFLIVCSAAASWRFVFMIMKPMDVKGFPADERYVEYFNKVKLEQFYYGIIHTYIEVIESYKSCTQEKAEYLKRAFSEIKTTGLLMVILIMLIMLDKVAF